MARRVYLRVYQRALGRLGSSRVEFSSLPSQGLPSQITHPRQTFIWSEKNATATATATPVPIPATPVAQPNQPQIQITHPYQQHLPGLQGEDSRERGDSNPGSIFFEGAPRAQRNKVTEIKIATFVNGDSASFPAAETVVANYPEIWGAAALIRPTWRRGISKVE